MKQVGRLVLFLAIGVLTWAAYAVPDARLFMHPDMARMIFFHLPCALGCTFFFYFGAYLSFRVLRTKSLEWDVRAAAANEIGMVLAVLTMLTGILFSRYQWGAFWSWDPRQTSFLFVLLLYGAYLVLRSAFVDPEKRAFISSAYAIFCVIPASFCIFVLPRIIESLHPSNTIIDGDLKGWYGWVTWSLVLCVTIFASMIYRLAVRAGLLELKILENYGNLETRSGDSPLTGVVRPISVSDEGRTQS
jgi:heme exporter protein C